jgi:CRP-like cAMP-binding protein
MDKLYTYINVLSPLSESSWEVLKSILVLKKYKMGRHLSHLNETPSRAYFLSKGYVRGYTLSRKGNHYNRALYQPNEFMASLSALIQNTKAHLALECLTDCETFECDFSDFLRLTKKYPDINSFYLKVLEANFIRFELRNIQLVTLSATDRYLDLRKRIPNIDNLISQVHIASHIGITPVQLSRIRKKIFAQK